MAVLRSEYRAAVAATALVPLTYLVFVVFGIDSGAADMWAPGFAVVLSALVLAGYGHTSVTPMLAQHVDQRRLVLRAAGLLVLVLLIESILSGLVGGFAPVAATDGPHSRPVEVRDGLNTMFGLPIGMLLFFGLGVWSSRLLLGPHPRAWLAAITVSSRAVRLLLYWPVAAYSRPRNVAIQGFAHMLVRHTVLGFLIFSLMALGNRYGHQAVNRPVDTSPDT